MTRTSWDTFLLVSFHIQIQIYKSPFLETLKEILREIDNKLTEEDLDGIIEEVDEDGSGTLDFDGEGKIIDKIFNHFISEFMEMMSGQKPHVHQQFKITAKDY